jgi:hypothetical protein
MGAAEGAEAEGSAVMDLLHSLAGDGDGLLGLIKTALTLWHTALARRELIAVPAGILALAGAAFGARAPRPARWAALTMPIGLWLSPSAGLEGPAAGTALLLLGLLGLRRAERPLLRMGALGLSASLAATGLDLLLHPQVYAPGAADPGAWPARHADPRVSRVDAAPPGVRCEFHDLDLVDLPSGRWAVVVAEGSGRLLAYPRGGGPPSAAKIPTSWGETFGVPLDSETDLTRGETWVLAGPHQIEKRTLGAAGWGPPTAVPLAQPEDHAYTFLVDGDQIALVHVNNSADPRPSWLQRIDRSPPHAARALPLRAQHRAGGPDAARLGKSPRHVIQRGPDALLISSDYHPGLSALRPSTGEVQPLLSLEMANGTPIWAPNLEGGRLLVPRPDRGEVQVIDLDAGAVTATWPAAYGVRTVAVDPGRGLYLTASVLDGAVEVRQIADGVRVERFGGLMPMVRELALDLAAGEAWLSTWGAVYRMRYAPPQG